LKIRLCDFCAITHEGEPPLQRAKELKNENKFLIDRFLYKREWAWILSFDVLGNGNLLGRSGFTVVYNCEVFV
jgi:hypothetical protein